MSMPAHWSERRDNRLQESDLDEAIRHASSYAAWFCRTRLKPGLDPAAVSSACVRAAWYAYCSYREHFGSPFSAHYRVVIGRAALRAVKEEQRGLVCVPFPTLDDGETEVPGETISPELQTPGPEQRTLLRLALETLPPAWRDLLILQFWGGATGSDFAEAPSTLSQRRTRALRHLRGLLAEGAEWVTWQSPEDLPAGAWGKSQKNPERAAYMREWRARQRPSTLPTLCGDIPCA